MYRVHRELWVARPREEVFDFFSRAENLERITPAWLRFRMLTPAPVALQVGARIEYRLRIHGMPVRWRTRIEAWDPPHSFVDVQERGSYRLWRHTHRFADLNGGTMVTDDVEYALPLGVLGAVANRLMVARDVAGIFDYRAARIAVEFGSGHSSQAVTQNPKTRPRES
jgi:ligand-binding SRPBCC domain-containing protein